MRKVVIAIGLPGSGKTSYLRRMATMFDYDYVCPDDIRQELSGDAADQSKMGEVWARVYELVRISIENGRDVIVDSTMVKMVDRFTLIGHSRKVGATKVVGFYFQTPWETCVTLNERRWQRVVPMRAMLRMRQTLADQPPTEEEGFDSIVEINPIKVEQSA